MSAASPSSAASASTAPPRVANDSAAGVDLDAGDADRCELAAHPVGCLDHRDGDAGASEIARDDQPGHPRADHDDARRLCERIGGRLR